MTNPQGVHASTRLHRGSIGARRKRERQRCLSSSRFVYLSHLWREPRFQLGEKGGCEQTDRQQQHQPSKIRDRIDAGHSLPLPLNPFCARVTHFSLLMFALDSRAKTIALIEGADVPRGAGERLMAHCLIPLAYSGSPFVSYFP